MELQESNCKSTVVLRTDHIKSSPHTLQTWAFLFSLWEDRRALPPNHFVAGVEVFLGLCLKITTQPEVALGLPVPLCRKDRWQSLGPLVSRTHGCRIHGNYQCKHFHFAVLPGYPLSAECYHRPPLPEQCSLQPCTSSACPQLPAASGPAQSPQMLYSPSQRRYHIPVPDFSEIPSAWPVKAATGAGQQCLLLRSVLWADGMPSWLQGFLIERAGRKTLLWKSYAVMALALGLLTVTLSLQVRPRLCIRAAFHLHVLLYGRYHYYFPPAKSLFSSSRSVFGANHHTNRGLFPAMYMQIKANSFIKPWLLPRLSPCEVSGSRGNRCLFKFTYLAVMNISNRAG